MSEIRWKPTQMMSRREGGDFNATVRVRVHLLPNEGRVAEKLIRKADVTLPPGIKFVFELDVANCTLLAGRERTAWAHQHNQWNEALEVKGEKERRIKKNNVRCVQRHSRGAGELVVRYRGGEHGQNAEERGRDGGKRGVTTACDLKALWASSASSLSFKDATSRLQVVGVAWGWSGIRKERDASANMGGKGRRNEAWMLKPRSGRRSRERGVASRTVWDKGGHGRCSARVAEVNVLEVERRIVGRN
ncbi:hypothetical protein R3P38DRAFT_2794200 [Favolaschia claudopus]|uniref:Uncharacterized protein n=1 Tax=Favolaschia claudopus TaxID=2862362 RepID=A0AAW0ACV1_9AGAR